MVFSYLTASPFKVPIYPCVVRCNIVESTYSNIMCAPVLLSILSSVSAIRPLLHTEAFLYSAPHAPYASQVFRSLSAFSASSWPLAYQVSAFITGCTALRVPWISEFRSGDPGKFGTPWQPWRNIMGYTLKHVFHSRSLASSPG